MALGFDVELPMPYPLPPVSVHIDMRLIGFA
jgi:hypothetical protein